MSRALPLDPDARRAQLLHAARTVFARKGYHKASVTDIIDEAGVARGTFYNYFEGKRTAFQAVLTTLMEQVTARVEAIDVTRPIVPQVRGILEGIVEGLVAGEDAGRLLLTEAVGIDEEGDADVREFWGQALARIARALRTGQLMGIVAAGDVELRAQILLGMVREPVFQAWLSGKELEPARLVDELLGLMAGGLLVAPIRS